jgi:hypothetical protein
LKETTSLCHHAALAWSPETHTLGISRAPRNLKVEHSKKLRTTFVDTMKMLPAAPDQGYVSYPTEEGPSFLSAGDEGDHTPEDLAGAKVRIHIFD